MITDSGKAARATLAVVSLGTSKHLEACLASLAAHVSATPFTVVWVNNNAGRLAAAETVAVPAHVQRIDLQTNLGWAGGLHEARAATSAEFFVWVQEDMEVGDGWLDALVAAADAHPEVAVFGSLARDAEGNPAGFAGGSASPADDVSIWNDTDTTHEQLPDGVTRFDWVTSKGMLTRTAAWDEIGGTDPRLFPLNHVDKDFCTHARAHGYGVALVPEATLFHRGSLSAPSQFRHFIAEWQQPQFNEQWGAVVAALSSTEQPVEHACHPWLPQRTPLAERADFVHKAVGAEAAAMIVPFARWVNRLREAEVQALDSTYSTSLSWRLSAPVRVIGALFRR